MLSQVYYIIRQRAVSHYLTAHPNPDIDSSGPGYLLVFCEYSDALGYLNTHSSNTAARWTVESVPGTQLGNLLKRWNFSGVGIVRDPLLPEVEFLASCL